MRYRHELELGKFWKSRYLSRYRNPKKQYFLEAIWRAWPKIDWGNKNEKAKNILDLAMEKMPLDYFGYYSLGSFVDTYYRLEALSSAQSLAKMVALNTEMNWSILHP